MQKRIDFSRAEQLGILRRAEIPAVEITESGKQRLVRPSTIKLVLAKIDDHGQLCWASLDTLARETGLSRISVVRAIAALEILSVLCISKREKRGGGFSNEYRIVWNDLGLLCPPKSTVPQGRTTVPQGNSAQFPQGTQSEREKRPLNNRGRALVLPDFKKYNAHDPKSIGSLYAELLDCGHNFDFGFVCEAVAIARRKGKRSWSGFLAAILRGNATEYATTIADTIAAKEIMRAIGGFEREKSTNK